MCLSNRTRRIHEIVHTCAWHWHCLAVRAPSVQIKNTVEEFARLLSEESQRLPAQALPPNPLHSAEVSASSAHAAAETGQWAVGTGGGKDHLIGEATRWTLIDFSCMCMLWTCACHAYNYSVRSSMHVSLTHPHTQVTRADNCSVSWSECRCNCSCNAAPQCTSEIHTVQNWHVCMQPHTKTKLSFAMT